MTQVGYMDQSMVTRLFHKSLIFRNTVLSTKCCQIEVIAAL